MVHVAQETATDYKRKEDKLALHVSCKNTLVTLSYAAILCFLGRHGHHKTPQRASVSLDI